MLKLPLFIGAYFILITVNGQVSVAGKITNQSDKPIVSASITLLKNQKKSIVAYAITNDKGQYTINYANALSNDTFYIKVNAVGYAIKQAQLSSFKEQLDFVLTPANILLPDVIVKAGRPALKYKSDTLTYAVDSFTQKQDRTIGDVLKKMPGIEVDANGRISYNGQTISNFYIDGDDLLADKYNIATNSIAADMVKDVQVLENHQPVRVLKNATYSDKVALNLNLKNKARLKLTARVEGGLGYANNPLYDAAANLMAFKKNYKAINSFKANNAGVDLSKDIISHNITDYLKIIQNNVPSDMLGLNTPGNPGISQQRYLFNNSFLANSNNLFKSKKGIQSRVNIYYLFDKQEQDYTNNNFFYFLNDTVKYLQQQNSQQKTNNLQLKYTLNANREKVYWNNILLITYNKLPAFSTTSLNGVNSHQQIQQQTTNITNEFNSIQTRRDKNIIELYSYFSYLTKPELLQISPGVNAGLFNNGNPYLKIAQQVDVPTYFTNNYIDYRVPQKKFLQSYRVGFTRQWQNLQSQTEATQINNSVNSLGNRFINQVNWQHQKIYAKAEYDYLGVRAKINLSIPFNWQYLNYSNLINNQKPNTEFNQLFVNPTIGIKYATGVESYVTATYTIGNDIATIQDVYGNNILLNHNQIHLNTVPIKQRNINSIGLAYKYRKSIKVLFFNVITSYMQSSNNSIVNTIFLGNIQRQSLIPFDNDMTVFSSSAAISKFLFRLKTTINAKASFKTMEFSQMQNSLINTFINTSYGFSAGVTPKINSKITASYNGSVNFSNSKPSLRKELLQSLVQMQHMVEINLFPSDNAQITAKGEKFYIKQIQQNLSNNYFFADASFLYKLNKYKADLVVELQNIANTSQYLTANVGSNNLTQTAFNIRPRTLFLKLLFNL